MSWLPGKDSKKPADSPKPDPKQVVNA